ncbi:MAG: hypothetical protein ACE5LB_02320 [Acidiferrobacterales bacterium]
MATFEFSISPDHPALAGHFPGNPIVPGVVLLDEIIRAAEAEASRNGRRSQVWTVPIVKFLRPLLPGQLCSVEFSQYNQGRIQFVCRSQGKTVATGQLCDGVGPASGGGP